MNKRNTVAVLFTLVVAIVGGWAQVGETLEAKPKIRLTPTTKTEFAMTKQNPASTLRPVGRLPERPWSRLDTSGLTRPDWYDLFGNQGNSMCSRFYDTIENPARGELCSEVTRPGSGSVGNRAIRGGYECRFNQEAFEQWLANSSASCPEGSSFSGCSDEHYKCVSSNNQVAGSCAPGYRMARQWTGVPGSSRDGWEYCDISTGGRFGRSWCSGFSCTKNFPPMDAFDDGVPQYVCQADGAMLVGGGCQENCCVFLED